MYYAPEIFKAVGTGTDAAFQQTVIIGIINVLFMFVAINWVDKLGRKTLLLLGGAGMGISLLLVGLAFHFGWTGYGLLFFILLYIASFAASYGPVTWVVISENFSHQIAGCRHVGCYPGSLGGRVPGDANVPDSARTGRPGGHLLDIRRMPPAFIFVGRACRKRRKDAGGDRAVVVSGGLHLNTKHPARSTPPRPSPEGGSRRGHRDSLPSGEGRGGVETAGHQYQTISMTNALNFMKKYLSILLLFTALICAARKTKKQPVDYVDCMYWQPRQPLDAVSRRFHAVRDGETQPRQPAPGLESAMQYEIENIAGFSHIHSWTMDGLLE